MDAQEFFRRAKGVRTRMEMLEERIARLRSNAERTTPLYAMRMGSGGMYDRYDYLAKVDEAEREYSALNIIYEDVIECIERVADRQYRNLLYMYYIDGLGWKEIGAQMQLGRTWLHVLHDRALAQVVVPDTYAECERLSDHGLKKTTDGGT